MPSALDNLITYIFDGASFYRRVDDEGFQTWVQPSLAVDVSPILDGAVYVDTGGLSPQPFEVTAAFLSRGERLAMIYKLGNVGTLEKLGYTAQAVLVAAEAHGLGDDGFWYAALTFQAIDGWPWPV